MGDRIWPTDGSTRMAWFFNGEISLNISELPWLENQLNLKLQRFIKKGALPSQIISNLGLIHKPRGSNISEKNEISHPWSPPKIKRNSWTENMDMDGHANSWLPS